MTGLKSGSGDDLWGDDPEDEDEVESDSSGDRTDDAQREESETEQSQNQEDSANDSSNQQQPYIVRRAIQDKSVQFEREERLTFFVHEDVANGERELVTEIESALGRDVPKFDVREAVYRAALRNRDDVLDELLKMGYSIDED
ncbi:hypothetical protein ACFQE1_00835 [Halobium palmae]|uniref:Uncharacterized protein n=1 Tax=Halobium palmae TaxID=1776492 RepID=A0ABD5RU74_9EURY